MTEQDLVLKPTSVDMKHSQAKRVVVIARTLDDPATLAVPSSEPR